MIYVVATTPMKPENKDDFIRGHKACIAETQKEKGCVSYEGHVSVNNPNLYVVVEDPRRPYCAQQGAAYEGVAGVFFADEDGADGDRDHQRRQG
jgi:hypothetical protein